MLLGVLLTAAFGGLLVVMGWLTNELLGGDAERWAERAASRLDTDLTGEAEH